MSRRILVTAGASGIGREFVRAFAALGDVVFVCDINADALKILKTEIPEIVTHVCDISKRAEIEKMVHVHKGKYCQTVGRCCCFPFYFGT